MDPKANFLTLPAEIKMQILKLLSLRDLRAVTMVCHDLRYLTKEPKLWRHLTLILDTRTLPELQKITTLEKLKLIKYNEFSPTQFLKLITSVSFRNIPSMKVDKSLRYR